jgi:hypothetical protein
LSRFSCEIESNENDESDLHEEKHREPRFSTPAGITMDFNEE